VDETAVKATIAGLIAKVESLQSENAHLRTQNAECAQTVASSSRTSRTCRRATQELRVAAKPARLSQAAAGDARPHRAVQRRLRAALHHPQRRREGKPFEVFFKLGKSGSCQQSYLEALGVAMSVGLRYGADPQKFVEKFEGMRCPNPKMRDANGPTTLSCADGISQGLAKALALAYR
jgi:hypothetical protein